MRAHTLRKSHGIDYGCIGGSKCNCTEESQCTSAAICGQEELHKREEMLAKKDEKKRKREEKDTEKEQKKKQKEGMYSVLSYFAFYFHFSLNLFS